MNRQEFPDNNQNGIPDVFENRRSIIEILQEDDLASPAQPEPEIKLSEAFGANHKFTAVPTLIMEIEISQRPPEKDEMYFDGSSGLIRKHTSRGYRTSIARTIVRRVNAPTYWTPIDD